MFVQYAMKIYLLFEYKSLEHKYGNMRILKMKKNNNVEICIQNDTFKEGILSRYHDLVSAMNMKRSFLQENKFLV